ncbi:MAG: tetratricopeptide repeat protein [Planctomycetales bacterium]|nr:tetratricopeptide repeat protein [Planctomycetales bacterium]
MKFATRYFAVLLSAVCLCGSTVSVASSQELFRDPDAEAALERGQKLLADENFSEALNEINTALQIDPTYDAAYIAKGDALQGLDEFSAAAAAYTKAIEIDANSAAAYNGRGECYLELAKANGQVDLAINDFRNALNLDRNDAKILANLGHVTVNYMQDPVGGIRLLDESLARDDQNARAYRDRGLAYAMLQDFDNAEADLSKSAEVEPDNHENFMTLAQVYRLQEEYRQMIDALTRAIAVYKPEGMSDPKTYIDALLLRADAWMNVAKDEQDKQARDEAYENVIADANSVLDEYDDRYPQSGIAYYRRGIAQRMRGEYGKAIDSLTLAIQSVPAGQDASYLVEAFLRRGITWFYQGSIELARGDFEQAAATGNGFRDPRIYLWLGYTYFKDDDLRTAIDYYGEAIAKDPDFALAHVNRGLAYMQLGEHRKALSSFSDAIRVEPSVGEHYYRAGKAYMAMEEFQKAADMFSLAALKDSENAKYRKAGADALRAMGKDGLGAQWEREAEQLPTE